ncbi:hypothetical protein KIL84_004953 [Mauremys mutica]|uniref:Uncharacterized protein n=1 Tax=Mauremys mutica TaxID=74926 RepID=A0A9D3WQH3_9SAUR|nr:hypothetical protein KIL84_004953 [Mauremys mutica]
MEPVLDKATIIRPSYISSIELSPRKWPVNVEDLKADLSDEFSLVSSNLDISQDNTVTTLKRQMPKENSDGTIEGTQSSESVKHGLDVGRKHCFESKPTQEEEPPTKKDTISTTAEQGAFRKNLNPMSEQKQKFAIRKLYHLRRRKSAKLNAK